MNNQRHLSFILASFALLVILFILCSGCDRVVEPSGNLGRRDEITFTATVGNSSVATRSSSEASDASAPLSADGKNMEATNTRQIYYDFAKGENISADDLRISDTRFSGEVFNVSVDNKAERLDWMPGDKITIFECVSGEFAHYKIDGINPEDGISKAALVPANTDGLRWNKNSDHKFLAIYPHLDSIMIAPEVSEYINGTTPYPYSVKVMETGANTGSIIPSTQYCTKVEGVRTSENWYEPKMKYAYMLSSALVPSSAVPTSDISLSFSPCFSSVEVKIFKPSGLSSSEVKLKSAALKGGSGSGADLSGTPALVHSGSDFGFTLSATENNGNALSGFGTAGNADQPNVVNLFFKNTDASTATPLLEEYSATSKPVCFTFLTLPSTDITQLELTLTLDIGGITETMTMKLKDAAGNWIELPAGKKLTISNAETWEDEVVTTSTPFTILTTEDNTNITINNINNLTFKYSIGGGALQTSDATPTITIPVPKAGQKVRLYQESATAIGYQANNTSSPIIGFDRECYVYGNIMSLCSEQTSFATATAIPNSNQFRGLFSDNANLSFHPTRKLLLPATTLAEQCYYGMFWECTGFTSIPEDLLPATTLAPRCYDSMFAYCTALTSLPSDLLPATTLAPRCYISMFEGCTALTSLPTGLLPATTLAPECYYGMFWDCTSLTSLPSGFTLPATTLAQECYRFMFWNCTSLTSLPSGLLPATTLAPRCYESMFDGCTALTSLPSDLLPATTLAPKCYAFMFQSCSSLTKAPHLPATEAKYWCYELMFNGCSNLNEVSCNLTTNMKYDDDGTSIESGWHCTISWLSGVAATGTFYANPSALAGATTSGPTNTTWHIDSPSGIPVNWTRHEEVTLSTPFTILTRYANTTITINNSNNCTFEYSIDGGALQTANATPTITISVPNANQEVKLYQQSSKKIGIISMSPVIGFDQECYVYGNIMSLCSPKASFATATVIPSDQQFMCLFSGNAKLSFHPTRKLFLPATTLKESCYECLFYNCTGLTSIPAGFRLPAETLVNSCYGSMFSGCTGLTSLPAGFTLPAPTLAESCYSGMFRETGLKSLPSGLLPAETLADNCYRGMFYECTGLTSLPDGFTLPAPKMAYRCYSQMFYKCTSLTSIPALPAETLAVECYWDMFFNCTSLTSIPALPAETLAKGCYNSMFSYCTGLTSLPDGFTLPATTLAKSCYESMFKGCTGLTSLPDGFTLPATTLAEECYYGMFLGCTGLTELPASFELPATTLVPLCYCGMFQNSGLTSVRSDLLPATTLAYGCYAEMFLGTKITKAPHLPAKEAINSCYARMFQDCSNLNEVSCNLTTNMNYVAGGITDYSSTYSSTRDWLLDVNPTGTFYADPSALAGATTSGPTNTTWHIDSPHGIPVNWTRKTLVTTSTPFTILTTSNNTTITINNVNNLTFKYSVGGGALQTSPVTPTITISVPNANQEVKLYQESATAIGYLTTSSPIIDFNQPCQVYGNIMSLCSPQTSFATATAIPSDGQFRRLFYNNENLIFDPTRKLFLPATTLTPYCYHSMFEGCTGLTSLPDGLLPATTLAPHCYSNMFRSCTGLTSLPLNLLHSEEELAEYCYYHMFENCTNLASIDGFRLPATNLAEFCYTALFAGTGLTSINDFTLPAATLKRACYNGMFRRCKNLVSIDGLSLSATTVAYACCEFMFEGCSSLTSIPAGLLRATIMEDSCYRGMFYNCTNLSSVPQTLLPATTLANACYQMMFQGCESLTRAPDLLAASYVLNCYERMFYGCKSLNYIKCFTRRTVYENVYFTVQGRDPWVDNALPSSGTIVVHSTVNYDQSHIYSTGIPTGWTILKSSS